MLALLLTLGAPVRDELGGALVPDAERNPKCCLCPWSQEATVWRCGRLTNDAAKKAHVFQMWQQHRQKCHKRMCYVAESSTECRTTCKNHMPPWVRGKLQTKDWNGKDGTVASMLAVGETAPSDCSRFHGVMAECMPTYAPASKAKKWDTIRTTADKHLKKALSPPDDVVQSFDARKVFAHMCQEKMSLTHKLLVTFSLTDAAENSCIEGFEVEYRDTEPRMVGGAYARKSGANRVGRGGGAYIYAVTNYVPLPEHKEQQTYAGARPHPRLVIKWPYALDLDRFAEQVRETYWQRTCRAMMPPEARDIILPAWLVRRQNKPEELLGPVMPRLAMSLHDAVQPIGGHVIPRDRMAAIAQQLFLSLAVMHRAKISHNDLKPENILLRCNQAGTAPPPSPSPTVCADRPSNVFSLTQARGRHLERSTSGPISRMKGEPGGDYGGLLLKGSSRARRRMRAFSASASP